MYMNNKIKTLIGQPYYGDNPPDSLCETTEDL